MFLLVPAYPGSPGQEAVKRLCVYVDKYDEWPEELYKVKSRHPRMPFDAGQNASSKSRI